MNKIKKFKIKPHLKDITRRIYKTEINLASAGIDGEAALCKFILDFAKNLNPGVIYQFFDRQNIALQAAGISSSEMFSVCVVTLGKEIEAVMDGVKDNFAVSTIYSVAFSDFLRTAVSFTADLIKEQAEKEEFETEGFEVLYSPVFSYGPEPKFLREAFKIEREVALKTLPVLIAELNAGKIDVSFEENKLTPEDTIVFLIPWNKKKKRRK